MQKIFICGLVSLSCLTFGLSGVRAEEQSQVVALADVPAAAQQTMAAESGNGKGKLGDIEKVQDDDEVWYEATLTKGKGQHRTFSVAPDGKLLSYQVYLHEIPEAVRKAIRAQARAEKDKIGDINRVTYDGKVTYEVDLTKGDKEISFTVDEAGKLLYLEVTLEELPDAVQKGIRAKAGDAVIASIEKNTSDDDVGVAYDVDAKKGDKKISFSVDADGKLMED
jgi:uncharacterized membrane protein YkoI